MRPGFVQSVDSEGNELDTIQLNGHSNTTAVGVPRLGDTVTVGQPFPTEYIPAGEGPGSQPGGGQDGMSSAAILAPGQTATQEFTILGSGRLSVNFNWVEVTNGLVPVVEQQ